MEKSEERAIREISNCRLMMNPWPLVRFLLGVSFGALALTFIDTYFEIHTPGTDVFLFKEAGVNLATQGKFVAAFLPHMAFGVEKPFAYYPPVYPYLFGIWTWLVGIGLKQSILFNSLLAVVRTVLMFVLVAPTIRPEFFKKEFRGARWMIGLFLIGITFVSTDRDRPDEMALIWGLLSLTCLFSQKNENLKTALGALFLALAGATSPAGGLFFGVLGGLWALSQKRPVRSLLSLGLLSSGLFLCMVLPILIQDSGSGARFSQQVGVSSFPYLRWWSSSWKPADYFKSFQYYFSLFRLGGSHQIWAALVVALFGLRVLWSTRSKEKKLSEEKLLLVGAVFFGAAVPFVWTLQPYYLWFPTAALIVVIMRWQQKTQSFFGAIIVLYASLVPLLWFEARGAIHGVLKPEQERAQAVQQEVLPLLERESVLAVSHDQYFTFRGKKAVVNAEYWMHEALQFDYLYLTNTSNSRQLTQEGHYLIPINIRSCFSMIKDFSTYTPIRVFGKDTGHFVRGSGGGLYKNICKTPTHS